MSSGTFMTADAQSRLSTLSSLSASTISEIVSRSRSYIGQALNNDILNDMSLQDATALVIYRALSHPFETASLLLDFGYEPKASIPIFKLLTVMRDIVSEMGFTTLYIGFAPKVFEALVRQLIEKKMAKGCKPFRVEEYDSSAATHLKVFGIRLMALTVTYPLHVIAVRSFARFIMFKTDPESLVLEVGLSMSSLTKAQLLYAGFGAAVAGEAMFVLLRYLNTALLGPPEDVTKFEPTRMICETVLSDLALVPFRTTANYVAYRSFQSAFFRAFQFQKKGITNTSCSTFGQLYNTGKLWRSSVLFWQRNFSCQRCLLFSE